MSNMNVKHRRGPESPSVTIMLCSDPEVFSLQDCLQTEEGTLPS